jgi:hypothetical protein
MNETIEAIQALSREEVLEAAGYFAASLHISADKQGAEQQALHPLTQTPFAHIADLEQLARLTLIAAASDPQHEAAAKKAIGGVGAKQFILAGTEIVALAVVALAALQTIVSKGKTGEREDIEIVEEEGKRTVKIRKSVKLGVSGGLAGVLSTFFKM